MHGPKSKAESIYLHGRSRSQSSMRLNNMPHPNEQGEIIIGATVLTRAGSPANGGGNSGLSFFKEP